MMSSFNKLLFTLAIVACSASGNAATIYGNNVSFTYDDSLTLFGTPAVFGDSLEFGFLNFEAQSFNGSLGRASDTFSVRIDSLAGKSVQSIALTEKGNYELEGSAAKVVVKGSLSATDAANSSLDYSDTIKSIAPFVQTADDETGIWKANAYLNFLPNASSVFVNIYNVLTARTAAGEFASIDKSFVGLKVTTVATQDLPPVTVPLPQAVWMFGVGLFGLLSVSKRKKLL